VKYNFTILILSIVLSLSYNCNVNTQVFEWVKQAGGTHNDIGYGISVDASGNSYVIGSFTATATFGTMVLTSLGDYDIFVAKYDANGNLLWVEQARGVADVIGYGISVDANGNIYVSGYYRETATFGNINLTSYGFTDIFIAKIENISTNVAEIILPQSNEYLLEENYPNPFNPTTTIKYHIPELSFVTLKVYDVLGNEVATLINEEKPEGRYEVLFNANGISSGIYYYRMQANEFVDVKKMIILK